MRRSRRGDGAVVVGVGETWTRGDQRGDTGFGFVCVADDAIVFVAHIDDSLVKPGRRWISIQP